MKKFLFLFFALVYYLLGITQTINNLHGITEDQSILFKTAKEYSAKSKPDKALLILYQLLGSVKQESDFGINLNISIAEAYRQKREYKKGINLLMSLLNTNNISETNKAHIYNRLSSIYGSQLNILEAEDSTFKYLNLCLKIAKKNNLKDLIASSQNESGYLFMRNEKYKEAEKLFKESHNYYMQTKQYVYAANVSINLSNIYLKYKDYNLAYHIIDSSIISMDEKQHRNMFMRLYLQKASVYEKWGRFDSAYKYLSKGRVVQKHFFNDKMDEHVFEMNAKFELQQKEKEVFKERLLSEKKQKENYFLIIIIVVLIIIVVGILISLRLRQISNLQKNKIDEYEKKLLQSKIDNKNKELSNAIAYAYSYNNSLQSIKETILSKSKDEALNAINVAINADYNWINFIKTFSELKPNFILNLEDKHPNVTENDKKLAALLSMKLTSKEISGVLNVELSAINKSRQRLRKKLDINSDINLNDYFNEIC